MESVQCHLQQTEADLQNPGDFLILQPQPSLAPYRQQLRIILPGGAQQQIDIEQGVSGTRSWNGDKINPILYSQIITKSWRGSMQWIDEQSWLVGDAP